MVQSGEQCSDGELLIYTWDGVGLWKEGILEFNGIPPQGVWAPPLDTRRMRSSVIQEGLEAEPLLPHSHLIQAAPERLPWEAFLGIFLQVEATGRRDNVSLMIWKNLEISTEELDEVERMLEPLYLGHCPTT